MPKTFQQKIKEERERLDLSLEQLGERIGSAKSYMWELENKESVRPSAEKVFKLANAFGVTPEYLMDDSGRVQRNVDQAFFSKFQKLSDSKKKFLYKFMDTLDDE